MSNKERVSELVQETESLFVDLKKETTNLLEKGVKVSGKRARAKALEIKNKMHLLRVSILDVTKE